MKGAVSPGQHTPSPITPLHLRQKASGGKSALVVAKDGGRVVGCAGIETRVVRDGQVTKMETIKGEVRCDLCRAYDCCLWVDHWVDEWVDRRCIRVEIIMVH